LESVDQSNTSHYKILPSDWSSWMTCLFLFVGDDEEQGSKRPQEKR